MHCLNLKITYECTNNCFFCFSSYLQKNVITLNGILDAVKRGYNAGCRELVISGGEPTLFPNIIKSIMSYAEELGYTKYIIQTNGSGLSNNIQLVEFLDSIANKKEVCISFSMHGHTSIIHDTMSRTEGAFEKLMVAMNNVKETKCHIYTNTVMSKLNIGYLKEIADLSLGFGSKIIQFSMMHLEETNDMTTSLLESSMEIRQVAKLVGHDVLKTEGIPYCLMHNIETCVGESYWPNKLDLYNKENDYMPAFNQLEDGMRWKAKSCTDCIMNEICMGIWKEHKTEFENAGIKPIY